LEQLRTIFEGLMRWQRRAQHALPQVVKAFACEVLHCIFIQIVEQAVHSEVPANKVDNRRFIW
jgi:hypothetical protein